MEITSFKKQEIIGITVIFLVLIGISVPNFALSLRRARDQVRRDDLGALEGGLDQYGIDFGGFPFATSDGKIMNCVKPGESVVMDTKGNLTANLIGCEWGKDSFVDLTPGSKKIYIAKLPQDPKINDGITYKYFSDGKRYQIYAYLEGGSDEIGYDSKIVARNILCGTKVCNVGRSYNVPINISIEEYDRQLDELNKLNAKKKK